MAEVERNESLSVEQPIFDAATLARFWAKVAKGEPDECWLWTASRRPKGYGTFWIKGRLHSAHRLSYILHAGAIPDDLWVLHDCDNPPCCNPVHLFLGTGADNAADMLIKQRHWAQQDRPRARAVAARNRKLFPGMASITAKLTDDQVRSIRDRVAAGETRAAISREIGVARSTVSLLVSGKTWKHLV